MPARRLHDRAGLSRLLIVLAGTVVFFFVHGALGVSPAIVALSGAALALLWVKPDVNDALGGVEWGVLLFLSGLFVMVGGLNAAGVLDGLAQHVVGWCDANPLIVGLAMMWGVAVVSGLGNNIAVTITMIPVIRQVIAGGWGGPALWWAVALGAGLGANSTVIGSNANVVVASVSERTRRPITPATWMRYGFPVAVLTWVVASVLYALLFGWLNTP